MLVVTSVEFPGALGAARPQPLGHRRSDLHESGRAASHLPTMDAFRKNPRSLSLIAGQNETGMSISPRVVDRIFAFPGMGDVAIRWACRPGIKALIGFIECKYSDATKPHCSPWLRSGPNRCTCTANLGATGDLRSRC